MTVPTSNHAAADGIVSVNGVLRGYSTDREHLADEFRLLDLRLREQISTRRQAQDDDSLAPFKGLVISDAEVLTLLESRRETYSPSEDEYPQPPAALIQLEQEIEQRRAASLEAGVSLALPRLAQVFHLTRFEEACLVVCLAAELDSKYEKLYAYLQDDATRKLPTVSLILDLLGPSWPDKLAAREVFQPQATLFKFKLLHMTDAGRDGPLPLPARSLKLDDRVSNFLSGLNQVDARLGQVARLAAPGALTIDSMEALYERTRDFAYGHFNDPRSAGRSLVFYFRGGYGSGKRAMVSAISRDLGLPLLIGDVEKLMSRPDEFDELVWLLCREVVFHTAVLCLENMDGLLAEPEKHKAHIESLFASFNTFSRLTFLLGDHPWQPRGDLLRPHNFIGVEFPTPDARTGREIWESQLRQHQHLAGDVDGGALASKFRFGPVQVGEALAAAEDLANWRSPGEGLITMADLHAACRSLSNTRLGSLARKIAPKYGWDDIVLPADQLAQLREICQQASYRHVVYGDWGFERKLSRGRGLSALFSGPPGTGKTMAAEVIARELDLDLYSIDLSQVVSKYIGETEKNLHGLFSEAQTSHAILFFDEADALFGKRSEVKDAHDRYANIEVGYLLQKMEEYEGIAILATNLRQHLDEAFVRRMQFIVEFPFPDEEHRRRIWEVTFPREAPVAEQVDFALLAREVKLAGGNIKNIGLAAAFYAAGDGGLIRMPHLIKAARREFQKLGRTWKEEIALPDTLPTDGQGLSTGR